MNLNFKFSIITLDTFKKVEFKFEVEFTIWYITNTTYIAYIT